MWRMTRIALRSLLAVFIVAGCVAGCAGPSDPPDPSRGSRQVEAPVTYQHEGGIAGFSDQLVVRWDGSYTFTGRHRSSGTGMLSPAELSELHRLLASDDFATVASYSPLRIADGFTHTIRYGDREVRAGDGNIPAALQPLIDLLGAILRRHGA
jgi:hypothetical protein